MVLKILVKPVHGLPQLCHSLDKSIDNDAQRVRTFEVIIGLADQDYLKVICRE